MECLPQGETYRAEGVSPAFGFAGGAFDPATALYDFPFRHYAAETGRWISPDPLGVVDGPNVYAYAGGDAVGRRDPLGLSWNTHIDVCTRDVMRWWGFIPFAFGFGHSFFRYKGRTMSNCPRKGGATPGDHLLGGEELWNPGQRRGLHAPGGPISRQLLARRAVQFLRRRQGLCLFAGFSHQRAALSSRFQQLQRVGPRCHEGLLFGLRSPAFPSDASSGVSFWASVAAQGHRTKTTPTGLKKIAQGQRAQ